MNYLRSVALILLLALALTACGEAAEQGTEIDFGDGITETTAEPDTSGENTGDELPPDDEDEETSAVGADEEFFSVEEYDYTAESDPDVLAYFNGDIGAALTKLAPSVKSVAYAAYCYPDDLAGDPSDQIVWCALYSMVSVYHQAEAQADENGCTAIQGSGVLETMAKNMFTAELGALSTPHEDFLDSLIFYDAANDSYIFEPSGGEGLEVRICALEASAGDDMNLTVQLYNSIFDFTSWVSLTITRNPASVYGYTVSGATAWNEE